ncbi:type III-B CRISPR module-associated protein Cmr5 [Streptomyces chiangmaiensis]|uniref:CRISPR type III-B/RAMP module-associated protein Cmr5 n=1 Tax=Streptomyces chiangmaiensis TaxID=766497 RepID=A0ABU7FNG5_9ACTN|nr:type III-B CRISPR module-associated protein Cmr5 [Streptomyces chiangmaiensis]MED7825499.1 type III-B CRISPR module-associated protein Cmr5 [Streptomyces chiangmaiensis]
MSAPKPVARLDQSMAHAASSMLPDAVPDRLRTRYRQLPVMLRISGLAATYAFILSSSRPDPTKEVGFAYKLVADGIRTHISEHALLGQGKRWVSNRDLLEAFAEADRSVYARVSAEIEALAGWLSRLAEARYREGEYAAAEAEKRAAAEGTA